MLNKKKEEQETKIYKRLCKLYGQIEELYEKGFFIFENIRINKNYTHIIEVYFDSQQGPIRIQLGKEFDFSKDTTKPNFIGIQFTYYHQQQGRYYKRFSQLYDIEATPQSTKIVPKLKPKFGAREIDLSLYEFERQIDKCMEEADIATEYHNEQIKLLEE